jgi:hypothetical protein
MFVSMSVHAENGADASLMVWVWLEDWGSEILGNWGREAQIVSTRQIEYLRLTTCALGRLGRRALRL